LSRDDNKQPTPEVGTVVAGKYRIERTLAEGGTGVVMAATHLRLDQSVALKFLRSDVSTEWDALARFTREAKAAAQLRSEHVAHVLDAGVTDDGTPYMVMEYLEGRSLARVLDAQGSLEVATAAEYVIQTCEGLAEAHSRGIVHRDIKPHNLFLVEHSAGWAWVKILDFGISKSVTSAVPYVTAAMVGAPCYRSPEALQSKSSADHRADIWSLGATLHELLVGRPPFDAALPLPELIVAILERPAPPLRQLRADVPEALEAIVARCLAKDREARFRSAGEMAMALLPFAPARARAPAERALLMRPAFQVAKQESDPAPAMTLPISRHDGAAEPVRDTPLPLLTHADESSRTAAVAEVRQPRSRRWIGVATLAAAAVLIFSTILVAGMDRQTSPVVPSVAVPMLTRPETVALPPPPAPPAQPEFVELVVRASPPSAQITVDGSPVPNPFHASYPKDNDVHRIAALAGGYEPKAEDVTLLNNVVVDLSLSPQASPPPTRDLPPAPQVARVDRPARRASTPGAPAATSTGAITGEPTGGRPPQRPIETRDPYGNP
jgi:serine/threonine-protein kinase